MFLKLYKQAINSHPNLHHIEFVFTYAKYNLQTKFTSYLKC